MKSDFHFFWESNSPFSNWYQPNNFTHNGFEYNCSEQYMMHMKAIVFEDSEVGQLIMEQKNPRKQKMLGREVRGFNHDVWMEVCQPLMVEGLVSKFTQDGLLKAYLLATGDKIIVEASPYDKIWGIGLTENDPKAWDQSTWEGLNLLGVVLMATRDVIRR